MSTARSYPPLPIQKFKGKIQKTYFYFAVTKQSKLKTAILSSKIVNHGFVVQRDIMIDVDVGQSIESWLIHGRTQIILHILQVAERAFTRGSGHWEGGKYAKYCIIEIHCALSPMKKRKNIKQETLA